MAACRRAGAMRASGSTCSSTASMRVCRAAAQLWKSAGFNVLLLGVLLLGRPEAFQHAFFEDFHLLLCVLQSGLAELEKLGAALVGGERLFEGHLPRFHTGDDLFELVQSRFERRGILAL